MLGRAHWLFEPKWDGFRVIVFRDGNEVFLQSRDERALNRHFPGMPGWKSLGSACQAGSLSRARLAAAIGWADSC